MFDTLLMSDTLQLVVTSITLKLGFNESRDKLKHIGQLLVENHQYEQERQIKN